MFGRAVRTTRAGGLFGVVATFAEEWLSGTVRARFRVQCDGAQMPS
jgi:hypothetical protein